VPTLGVRRDCRRHRYADRLLKEGLTTVFTRTEAGRPCVRAWLHCLAGNDAATALYTQRFGFAIVNFFPGFYRIRGWTYDANLLAVANPSLPTTLHASVLSSATFAVDDEDDDGEEQLVENPARDNTDCSATHLAYFLGAIATVFASTTVAILGSRLWLGSGPSPTATVAV
jgi:hypothetical protein